MRLSIEEDNMTTFPRTSVEARHFDATLGMFVPNGYNAEQNCRWAEQHVVSVEHKIRALAAATPGIRSLMGLSVRMSGSLYFYMVGSGGEWDYKRTSSDLADAGNYNFGYTALCAGLTLVEAKAAGGIYQVLSGTSKLGWWDSLFDDPVDAAFIEKGVFRRTETPQAWGVRLIHYFVAGARPVGTNVLTWSKTGKSMRCTPSRRGQPIYRIFISLNKEGK